VPLKHIEKQIHLGDVFGIMGGHRWIEGFGFRQNNLAPMRPEVQPEKGSIRPPGKRP
jgi:hypothetical protein